MKADSKILVAPLDWGLGHASRCVPIVQFLVKHGFEVIIGGSGESLAYLQKRFPSLVSVELPSAKMNYGKQGMISLPFMFSMLRFVRNISREHRVLGKLIAEESIDYVFSDNRLGLYSSHVPSFYMTHQLNFDTGFLNRFSARMMNSLHRRYMNKYRYCFVPDTGGELSLSGKMSDSEIETRHLGPLSRFYGKTAQKIDGDFDLLLLSGIEPQRTMLENIFIEKYSAMSNARLHIIRGVADGKELVHSANITYENAPSDDRIASLVVSAKRIFCRSGYSTLCDLAALGRRAVLVPTPRQPEQEYLAIRFHEKFGFVVIAQEDLPQVDILGLPYDSVWKYDYRCSLGELLKE